MRKKKTKSNKLTAKALAVELGIPEEEVVRLLLEIKKEEG